MESTVNTLPAGRNLYSRDIFMDTLRVASLAVVIAFHWLGLLPQLQAGVYTDREITTAVPGLWPLTWLIDILPLFLFVGGFANARSYDASRQRGETDSQFLGRRCRRILVPTLVFIGACIGLMLIASWLGGLFGPTLQLLSVRNTAPFGQLWFIGVYLLQIALVPVTLRAHRRFEVRALVVIIMAAAMTDVLSWCLNSTLPLLLNVAFVWMVPHQLGYFYADERLGKLRAGTWVTIALIALGSLAMLTSLPFYSRDLLDPHKKVLTVQAFTFPLVLQSMWIIAIAMLLRPGLVRLLQAMSHFRNGVERVNRSIMSLFLWHSSAYLFAVLALSAVPGVMSYTPTAAWWEARPVVVLGSAGVLVVMFASAAVLRRAEAHVQIGLHQRGLLR